MPENGKFISIIIQFIAIFAVIFSFQVKGQEISKPFFAEKGFNIGLSAYSILLPDGKHYRPLLLMGNLGIKLSKNVQKSSWWIMLEPQINPVFFGNQLKEVEFGVNVAFRYKYQLAETIFLYGQLGSGPHFITIPTERQAHGFIFSDNLAIGVSKFLINRWMLNTELRIRHISNANVMKPNRGMNNFFVIIGLSKKISK
ncbi:MAG: acyloxyacyl hydrolase [Bacteroidales bacterium]